ncbi:MAG: PilT/PilU family type 4a pilus ATPase [Halofilum sp. (in: g-proteobacteria)]|nr:PilT/PilU family type 4a pilus ATPase [Halofilum sp. (in: g-proteobacteria)]
MGMEKLDPYLKYMADKGASDCYFTTGAPPAMRIEGDTHPVGKQRLEPGVAGQLAYSMMSQAQQADFERDLELNMAFTRPQIGRFRVNIYRQRGEISFVIRHIKFDIPELSTLNLPEVLPDIVNQRKGLILVVGSTGSGKSTTLASMLDYRNRTRSGHILTVEDPIEYMFRHQKSIVGQREVGIDTHSFENALREAMREAPDVIMIGEVRDRASMEHAISYADTGHLCLSTLHAVNTYQALDRIINMFPPEGQNQIFMDLSLNLKGVVSQRLVPTKKGARVPAVEVMLNSPYISELIRKGQVHDIHEAVGKGARDGMQTFDQSLFELFKQGHIDLETALDHADSRSDLEWRINFGGGIQSVASKDKSGEDFEFPEQVDELPQE